MRDIAKQERSLTYKNKSLPCNKKEEESSSTSNIKRIKKGSSAHTRKGISNSITYRIKKAGLKKGYKKSRYINIKEMVKNLESQFDENMTWENYGIYWDIDHILPKCLFDFSDMEQIRACWSNENVRPLRKEENALKSDTIDIKLIEEYELFHILEIALQGDKCNEVV